MNCSAEESQLAEKNRRKKAKRVAPVGPASECALLCVLSATVDGAFHRGFLHSCCTSVQVPCH